LCFLNPVFCLLELLILDNHYTDMRKIEILLPVWSMLVLFGLMGMASGLSSSGNVSIQQATPTRTSAMPPPTTENWIILDLPPDASQLEIGAEVYRLVCKACHGDRGQGLTDDWRAQWAPEDQNCWQSKCHAANHPPDGFSMPVAPAVVGSVAMSRFYTAYDLYKFISTSMPWQAPGRLSEEQDWQVTAYILQMNGIDPGGNLDPETASQIKLGREQSLAQDNEVSVAKKKTHYVLILTISLLILLVISSLYVKRKFRK